MESLRFDPHTSLPVFNPLDATGISLNKQKLMYNILTPSITAPYKFLWTYGGSGHIVYACGLLRVNTLAISSHLNHYQFAMHKEGGGRRSLLLNCKRG